jgi:hypothetical protein
MPLPASGKVDIITTGASNVDFVGKFWESGNSNANNGTCQASAWWLAQDANRKVQEQINSTVCPQGGALCPNNSLTLVIEDYDEGGAPGVGGTAYFMAFTVDETPTEFRIFDMARVIPGTGTLTFLEFPTPEVTGSGRTGSNVDTVQNWADVAVNFMSATGASDDPVPTGDVIVSYDLMKATGLTDPGRDRSNWTLLQSFPYQAGYEGVQFSVPCDDEENDAFIALGFTFAGGTGGDVPSSLVGRAIALECDPFLAEPEPTARPKPVPAEPRKPTQVRRGGGR